MSEEKEKEILEVGTITFSFPITRDEADAVLNKPKSTLAKKLRRYMMAILKAGATKMLETKQEEEVKNCKLDIE
jgi:hypothetical protein